MRLAWVWLPIAGRETMVVDPATRQERSLMLLASKWSLKFNKCVGLLEMLGKLYTIQTSAFILQAYSSNSKGGSGDYLFIYRFRFKEDRLETYCYIPLVTFGERQFRQVLYPTPVRRHTEWLPQDMAWLLWCHIIPQMLAPLLFSNHITDICSNLSLWSRTLR